MIESYDLNIIYDNILARQNLRENLSELKMALRRKEAREELENISGGDYDFLMRCLSDEDPKVRKNAAAVLGEAGCQEAVDVLADAWEAEETLFVRPEYLKALSVLDCRQYLPLFRRHLKELEEAETPANQVKHIRKERNALAGLLQKYGRLEMHRFRGFSLTNDIFLRMHPAFTEAVARQIKERHRTGKSSILVRTDRLEDLLQLRPVREFLFLTDCRKVPGEPAALAQKLLDTGLTDFLQERLEGEPPYYFRVGISGAASPERTEFLKKTAAELERTFSGILENRPSGYEVELLLAPKSDGSCLPLVRFCSLPDHRFAYRREKPAQDIRPDMAAGILELARPYLKPHGQVLDPFCSAGTLLIERCYMLPTGSVYGVDRYGKAIEAARRNTAVCGMEIYYVNRDFLDFTHSYPFDEILADMPGSFKDREEKDIFYRKFLEKCQELLAKGGVVVCRSTEMGILKKQLRLHKGMRLEQEIPLNEKTGDTLFILRVVS